MNLHKYDIIGGEVPKGKSSPVVFSKTVRMRKKVQNRKGSRGH